MNKIILAILIGIAISSLTYGALNAPAINVQLAFLGFFTGADKFSNFDCICTHPLPNDPNDPGFTSTNCLKKVDVMGDPEEPYAIDASGDNICT